MTMSNHPCMVDKGFLAPICWPAGTNTLWSLQSVQENPSIFCRRACLCSGSLMTQDELHRRVALLAQGVWASCLDDSVRFQPHWQQHARAEIMRPAVASSSVPTHCKGDTTHNSEPLASTSRQLWLARCSCADDLVVMHATFRLLQCRRPLPEIPTDNALRKALCSPVHCQHSSHAALARLRMPSAFPTTAAQGSSACMHTPHVTQHSAIYPSDGGVSL